MASNAAVDTGDSSDGLPLTLEMDIDGCPSSFASLDERIRIHNSFRSQSTVAEHMSLPERLPGPRTALESVTWAQANFESLSKQGLRFFGRDFTTKALESLSKGVLPTTDFSGIGSPEEALHHTVQIAKEEAGARQIDFSSATFCCLRAGDKELLCRQVLNNHAGLFRPQCIHKDILDRCGKNLPRS